MAHRLNTFRRPLMKMRQHEGLASGQQVDIPAARMVASTINAAPAAMRKLGGSPNNRHALMIAYTGSSAIYTALDHGNERREVIPAPFPLFGMPSVFEQGPVLKHLP